MKQEKFKQVLRYAQNLGLTPQEVFNYMVAEKQLGHWAESAPQPTKNNQFPCSGMFCFEDNSCSFELEGEKNVKGIVVYVSGKKALLVCLAEIRLPWSTNDVSVALNQKELDGAKATQNILAAAKDCRLKAEAAEWCHAFAQNGVKSGEAFLPSVYEMIKISDNKERINEALKKLNLVSLSGWYWTSNESDQTTAVLVRVSDARENVFSKRHMGGFVRPAVWVNL